MFLFQKLLNRIRAWFRRDTIFGLDIDADVIEHIQQVAIKEQRLPQDVAKDIIRHSVAQYMSDDENLKIWHTLRLREQQVVALICMGYSNRQIALSLHLAEATIKTYAGSAYVKFGVHNRNELRRLLADWDFTPWLEG